MNPNDHSPAVFDLTQKQEEPQNRYKITVGGIVCTKQVPMPIKWEELLDERLDSCRMTVKQAKKPVIEPLTEVKIEITDKLGKTLVKTWVVSADSSSEVPVGSGRYNHELILVEETKKLEGIIIEPLTYTNDLGRAYAANQFPANYEISGNAPNDWFTVQEDKYYTAMLKNENFVIWSFKDLLIFNNSYDVYFPPLVYSTITCKYPNGKTETLLHQEIATSIRREIDTSEIGEYKLVYSTVLSGKENGELTHKERSVTIVFHFSSVPYYDPLPKWNITSVIDRLLDLAEPHLKNDETKPRYRLNAEQAEEFVKIESPEFAFSKMTLKEALDQIGGFIHGVPRLKGNTIYFDMLGGTEQAKLADPKYPYISNQLSQDIENYATKLDSTVDNLVNMIDSDEGVIVEPYSGGYKSVRTEDTYAAITESGMIIPTSFPIYDVRKLEFGGYDGKGEGKSLTAYVFEAADYGTMSSFEGAYPTSKSYAIYYTQGEKNIKGLGFKEPSAIAPAFKKYAIVNIIEKATGVDVDETAYPKLKFRITYTPIFSSRVEQHKLYYKDMQPRTLAYNQSANLIETRFYGENLKGTIARMGNTEVVRTYRLNSTSLIPKKGQAWGDDYFVSAVTVAMYPFYFDCTVGLTKDYNRRSQYIGINSSRRMFEVSEKQAYNRDMIYTDYVVIGDEPLPEQDTSLSQQWARDALKATFIQDGDVLYSFGQATLAIVNTYNELNEGKISEPNNKLAMPVVSTAMGNAMVFSFSMDNNYSAGEKSVFGDGKYWQTNTPYCDYYGRFDFASVKFYSSGTGDDEAPFELPQATGTEADGYFFGTKENNPLVVRKNNTEIIKFNYCLHYVTNKKEIIVGPALTHNCPLVRGVYAGHTAALYVLPVGKKIGKFDRFIDLTNATLICKYSPDIYFDDNPSPSSFKFKNIKSTVDGSAWVIVDDFGDEGSNIKELLLGANVSITSGEDINLPCFSIVHDLYKEDEE